MLAGEIREYVLKTYNYNSKITSLIAPNRHENGLDNKMYGFWGKI